MDTETGDRLTIGPDAQNPNNVRIYSRNDRHVAKVYGYSPEEARTKALRIVNAVNNQSLSKIDTGTVPGWVDRLKAALHLHVGLMNDQTLTLVPQGYRNWAEHVDHHTSRIANRAVDELSRSGVFKRLAEVDFLEKKLATRNLHSVGLTILFNQLETRRDRLQEALNLALDLLEKYEPPDARAMSNEFVALAAVACDIDDQEEAVTLIQERLAEIKARESL